MKGCRERQFPTNSSKISHYLLPNIVCHSCLCLLGVVFSCNLDGGFKNVNQTIFQHGRKPLCVLLWLEVLTRSVLYMRVNQCTIDAVEHSQQSSHCWLQGKCGSDKDVRSSKCSTVMECHWTLSRYGIVFYVYYNALVVIAHNSGSSRAVQWNWSIRLCRNVHSTTDVGGIFVLKQGQLSVLSENVISEQSNFVSYNVRINVLSYRILVSYPFNWAQCLSVHSTMFQQPTVLLTSVWCSTTSQQTQNWDWIVYVYSKQSCWSTVSLHRTLNLWLMDANNGFSFVNKTCWKRYSHQYQ